MVCDWFWILWTQHYQSITPKDNAYEARDALVEKKTWSSILLVWPKHKIERRKVLRSSLCWVLCEILTQCRWWKVFHCILWLGRGRGGVGLAKIFHGNSRISFLKDSQQGLRITSFCESLWMTASLCSSVTPGKTLAIAIVHIQVVLERLANLDFPRGPLFRSHIVFTMACGLWARPLLICLGNCFQRSGVECFPNPDTQNMIEDTARSCNQCVCNELRVVSCSLLQMSPWIKPPRL